MRSTRATHNQIAVSAKHRETAINTEQTLDTLMPFSLNDIINLAPRREDDTNEANGREEASRIYDRGALAEWAFNVEKAQPQHFAFLMAYCLGSVTTAALGDGYKHTITPIEGGLDSSRDNPSFTAAQRLGKTINKRRFASMFIDSLKYKFAKDAWVTLSGTAKGTGKVTNDYEEETVSALDNVTSLTLAAKAVAGSSADERLANVQAIKVELATGVWTDVVFSAVSSATPAVITITSAGGAGSATVNYKILYRPTEAAWGSFPAQVVEDALKVSQLTLNIGGTWDGAAFSGGKSFGDVLKSIEGEINDNGECSFVPGTSGDYAGKHSREARSQKVTLEREFYENIFQQLIADNSTFGIYMKAEGELYDSTYKYQVEIIYPSVGVLQAPISVDGKKLGEKVEIVVFEHATYGSIIVTVQNLVDTYAA
ncbi:MAG: hypothetical protein LLG40_15740 [Deltaproteobacteria bacterium]|nr:hypothetical protein [Deltaproteobacteria bacterium]